jgi:hypothetical protein
MAGLTLPIKQSFKPPFGIRFSFSILIQTWGFILLKISISDKIQPAAQKGSFL